MKKGDAYAFCRHPYFQFPKFISHDADKKQHGFSIEHKSFEI